MYCHFKDIHKKEACPSYRHYSLFPSSQFAVISSFVILNSELNYISILQGRRISVCITIKKPKVLYAYFGVGLFYAYVRPDQQ